MSHFTNNPFWRLLPGNPIFLRVVESSAKRGRHAVVRIVYLAVMVFVAVLSLLVLAQQGGGTLTVLSRQSATLFTYISFAQLGMACLMAPIFTAGAITQEKDNQTYNVLLSTPLSNAQIVLGSLISRLYFVLVLLASGIPIFLITQLYGGVPGRSILLSFMIAASTAIFTGSLAVAIAVMRVGTGRTIFAFYILITLYIAVIWFLGSSSWMVAPYGPPTPAGAGNTLVVVPENPTSWLTALHPFLSLMVVLNMATPPDASALPGASWLTRLWLCQPHYAYLTWTLGASVLMVGLGTIFLRLNNARTRIDLSRRIRQWFTGSAVTRKPRTVWNNPVAWREAATRASAGGMGVMRWLFLIGGLAFGAALLFAYAANMLTVDETRSILRALLWVELTIVLLVLCNVSASAITRERESSTLDLLLVTPITSRYYIWGKLRGLISFAAVMLAVPVGTALLFAVYSLFRPPAPIVVGYASGLAMSIPLMPLEAVPELAVGMLAFCAMTVMTALTMSLKVRRTVGAVIWSVAIVGTVGLGATACGLVSAESIPTVGPMLGMASPYVAISLAIAPHEVAQRTFEEMNTPTGSSFRVVLLVQSAIAAAIYCLIVWGMYSSMVKNFDMTIRRQSR